MPFPQDQNRNLFRKAFLRKEKKAMSRKQGQRIPVFYTIFLVGFWLAFIGGVMYTTFYSPWLRITEVSVKGISVIPKTTYEVRGKEILHGFSWKIIPRDNLLIFPRKRLIETLLVEYPKLQNVTVTRKFPHSIEISLMEKEYLVEWCSAGPCVLVGNHGEALSSIPAKQEAYEPWLLTLVDRSGAALPKDFSSNEKILRAVEFFEKEIPKRTAISLEHSVEMPNRYAGELEFQTNGGWNLLISTDIPNEETLAVLESLEVNVLTSEKEKNLVSVDLRIGGRIFLKYENTSEEGVSAETSAEVTTVLQ